MPRPWSPLLFAIGVCGACAADDFRPAPDAAASGAGGSSAGQGQDEGGRGGSGGSAGSTAGSSSAGKGGAGGSGASGGSEAGGGAAGGSMGTCPSLFVSPAGQDGPNRGCSAGAPLRTVVAALGLATQSFQGDKPVKRIYLCIGEYAETQPLVLSVPVSLLGGHTICEPSGFSLPPGITPPDYAAAPPTKLTTVGGVGFVVDGPTIGRDVVLSRLAIVPSVPAGGPSRGVGMEIRGGASPTLEHDYILGADGKGAVFGSAGLLVEGGAAPLVKSSVLQAGAGSLAGSIDLAERAAGSVGAFVGRQAGVAEFRFTKVLGGAGSSTLNALGSAGLVSFAASVGAYDSAFVGGLGITMLDDPGVPEPPASAAIRIAATAPASSPQLILDRSIAIGGLVEGKPNAVAYGLLTKGATVQIDRTRIYAGDANVSGATGIVSYGIFQSEGSIDATNTLVHGGGVNPDNKGFVQSSRGVFSAQGSFSGNYLTVLAGRGGAPVAIGMVGGLGSVVLERSLVVAQAPNTLTFVSVFGACGGGSKKVIKPVILTDVIVAAPETAMGAELFRSLDGCPSALSPADLVTRGFGVTRVLLLKPPTEPASAPPGLVPFAGCTTNATCASSLFGLAYAPKTAGLAELLTGTRLAPACQGPPLVREAVATIETPNDLAETPRKMPGAVGAYEAACP